MITPATYRGPVHLPCGHVVHTSRIPALHGVCAKIILVNGQPTLCNKKFNPDQVVKIETARLFCLDLAGKLLGAFLVMSIVWYYGYFERGNTR